MIKLYIKHDYDIIWKCLVTALVQYLKGEPDFRRNKAYAYLKFIVKLMKEKALRMHSLHEKTASSVLLKLFISGTNDTTPLTPPSA